MKVRIRQALAALPMLVVTACASTLATPVDPALNDSNSARLMLYRTHEQFGATDSPAFYLDDQPIGTTARGGEILRRVPGGLHRLTLRGDFHHESASFSTVFEPGRDYYIRFGVSSGGSVLAPWGYFHLMDEAAYRRRQ